MRSQQPPFDITALKRVEQVYRNRLVADPSDLVARTGLAWCLFMQALHQAGQETILAALIEAGEGQDAELGGSVQDILQEDARAVLKEALRQAMTVMQLSRSPEEQVDVERLATLIRLSGGEGVVLEAEDETNRMLAEISHALTAEAEPRTRRPARRRRKGPPP